MKRLAIFIGGLLVMPAFAEVAPVFIDENDAIEYADGMYDENGFFVAPEEIVETETEADTQKMQTPVKISRAPVDAAPVANRTTSTRAMPASAGATTASGRGSANGNSSRVVAARTTTATPRATASRTVASRGTTATSPRTGTTTTSTRTATSMAATRAAAARTTGGATRATSAATGATVARTATSTGRTIAARTATATTARAATSSRPSVDPNRNVEPGYKGTATVTSIGTVDTTNKPLYNKSASTRRTPTIRMSSLNGISAETTAVSTMSLEDMDDLAELTDYCKAQYANCMDNYCNVLDDNQGRCSCSANLKNYARAEAALKTATEELQDVAQKIQYIGLTTREVETLFTETIAEETMRTKGTDNSQLQASLNKIKDMIIDVKSGTATSSASNDILGLNFDLSGLLEFSFDSTGFDLGSLFGTTNTNSVSNQRGEELYKTAAARCKSSVLKACTARGVDASIITNAYDLEIDRECMAYERSLNDSNDQMLATVRNAKNVLQKARLMVAQQKNAYDMRGCINALDACMQDEFVCGSDYENCLDPTGRYIVNGEIVIGSQPGHAIDPEYPDRVASVMTSDVCRVNLYRTWDMVPGTCEEHTPDNYIGYPTTNQGNAWGSGTEDTLSKYIEKTVSSNSYPIKTSENMSLYLQNKIGYNQNDRNYGMCMSVLNKCQDYTYTNGKGLSAAYDPANQVVQQYLARVLVQIKAKQDEILANYAETCVSDVTSCLGQNGYPTEDPEEWGATDSAEYRTNIVKTNIAVNACRAQIVTCMSVNGYSIDTPTPTEMNCWVQGLLYNHTTSDCLVEHSTTIECSPSALQYCGPTECGKLDNSYTWCTTGSNANRCVLSTNCTSDPTEYNVIISCGDHGTWIGTGAQPVYPVPIGSSISLNWSTYCTPKNDDWEFGYWTCGNSNTHLNNNYQYKPSANNTTCTAHWQQTNPEVITRTLKIECGRGGYFTGSTVGNSCNSSGSCGQISVISNNCVELNDYCKWPLFSGGVMPWNCTDNSLSNGDHMCPQTDNITCTAGIGPTPSTNYSVNLTCGIGTTGDGYHNNVQSGTPVLLSGRCQCDSSYNRLSWNGECAGKTAITVDHDIDCTATCSGSGGGGGIIPPGDECDENDLIKCVSPETCNAANGIWLCASTNSCTCMKKGGMRYVKIEDNGGARAQQGRKGGMLPSDTQYVWIDTDGSTCQYPGVYIADPNTNMVVCTTRVDSIGWWVKPGSRSSGFYIDVNGEKVLFAREWGEIVTENIGKFAATDPDTTLVATPTVYDTNVGYVSFDEVGKTWTDTYLTSDVDPYAYLHNKFNIDFYPNRPGLSGSQDPTDTYTYIEGDNYYKRNGSPTNKAPTITETETGYTFRGFYPGKLSAVSDNDRNGMVWPAATGGMSPVTLSNKKWVLVTDNPDFQTLNLYAAWAKNCPSPIPAGMAKCNLTIGTDGSVTYAVECMDGYEIQGAGADAKCVDQNAGDWHNIEFPGATAD